MATKNRTPILIHVPNEWLPAIDERRGKGTDAEEPRTEFILESVRARLGKREFPKPPGRGRPRNTTD